MRLKEIEEKNRSNFYKVLNDYLNPSEIESLKPLLDYLDNSDYYYAPAASRYHGNYPGGLYDHSYGLFSQLIEFKSRMKKNWDMMDLVIIAFFHDLCKVNLYRMDVSEEGVVTYSVNGNQTKHGLKSLEIMSSIAPHLISKVAAESILYHMGIWTYDVPNLVDGLKSSQTENDLVFFTHAADMIESRSTSPISEVKLINEEFYFKYE